MSFKDWSGWLKCSEIGAGVCNECAWFAVTDCRMMFSKAVVDESPFCLANTVYCLGHIQSYKLNF